jgi:hypothetical protein
MQDKVFPRIFRAAGVSRLVKDVDQVSVHGGLFLPLVNLVD